MDQDDARDGCDLCRRAHGLDRRRASGPCGDDRTHHHSRCTIEAGLYITAGTPVALLDEHGTEVRRVKARELAGASDLLFIRNGLTGRIECRTNRKAIELNELLHAHN